MIKCSCFTPVPFTKVQASTDGCILLFKFNFRSKLEFWPCEHRLSCVVTFASYDLENKTDCFAVSETTYTVPCCFSAWKKRNTCSLVTARGAGPGTVPAGLIAQLVTALRWHCFYIVKRLLLLSSFTIMAVLEASKGSVQSS